ncbi:MAG TPA: CPBP family glutamic-type intramembrane protease [Polyangiaceae bacterium]|nr:CPBP family glutamic-type intramembrane protease [Polyangiaceae bacterium]
MTAQAAVAPAARQAPGARRTDAITDVALTAPLFVIYHVGVAFLPLRNAADVVTSRLAELAEFNRAAYLALTVALGVFLAGVLLACGHRDKFRWETFALVALEGAVYAVAMRWAAGYATAALATGGVASLAPGAANAALAAADRAPLLGPAAALGASPWGAVVLSCGAGVYEELAFRVLLFGIGARLLVAMDDWRPWLVKLGWAVACAAAFSLWHHTGPMAEPFALEPFLFRTVCGLAFTAIYAFRGFAPAVWTHALYDVWVLV